MVINKTMVWDAMTENDKLIEVPTKCSQCGEIHNIVVLCGYGEGREYQCFNCFMGV